MSLRSHAHGMPYQRGGLRGCVLLEVRKKEQKLDIDPDLVTQYKDNNNKQVKVYSQPVEEVERVPIDETPKKKKRKRKYLPAERLIQELMGKKTDTAPAALEKQQEKDKMDKIANSLMRILGNG
jgi:hypothetical protein